KCNGLEKVRSPKFKTTTCTGIVVQNQNECLVSSSTALHGSDTQTVDKSESQKVRAWFIDVFWIEIS
ncbi:hypothetical protein Prudu_022958, partial [Prunus dulcis]